MAILLSTIAESQRRSRLKDRSCGCHSHNGFRLSPEGLAQREFDLPGVDSMAARCYLDKVGSVSALELDRLHWDDDVIEEQYRRFLHAS